jgi:hypothetical protein
VDAHGIITATGSITGADLTSGEIGGSTSMNTSGDLATTGDIGAGGDITAGGNVSSGSVSTGSLSTTGGITSVGDVSVTGVGGKVSATNGEFRRLHLLDDQATPHYVEVRSPDPLTANYTLTLPGSLGSANQLLGMNNAGNALENKTLTAGTGVTITHSAGGIEIAASGSGGTVTSVTGTAPIVVDNSNPNTPIVTLGNSGVGVGTYGSATEVPVITVDAKGRITSASNTTISGVSPAGSNLATGKAWIGDGTGKAAEAYINVSDLKKSDGTPQIPSTCTASQTMTWSSVTDVFTCSNITVTKSQISDFPTLGTAALEDVGTNAGDVVQLDPSGKLPAVDGSQLTNLTLPSYDTTYFKQGGNDFSATATLGTTGNNDLKLITNNTTKMTVLANGNVGIGTSSPQAKMDINISDSGGDAVRLYDNRTGSTAGLIFDIPLQFSGYMGNSVATIKAYHNEWFGYGKQALAFDVSGNEKLRITDAGNIGIGTAKPDVSGFGSGYTTVTVDTNTADKNANVELIGKDRTSTGAFGTISFLHNDAGTYRKLAAIESRREGANDAANLQFTTQATGGAITERMRIASNGNIGIGTTSPGAKLDVNGAIKSGSAYINVATYMGAGIPANGLKIKTNIPATNSYPMSTIVLEGYNYAYGSGGPIGIVLTWYYYGGSFYSKQASLYGSWAPSIQLAEEGGKVVVFLNKDDGDMYFVRFTVRALGNGTSADYMGWTVVDEAITGTNVTDVPYKNKFGMASFLGKVGIGTTSPVVSLDVGKNTDAIRIPAGTSAQKPSSPANGMIRYNSDNSKFEAYENGAWTNMIGGSASSASSVAAGAGSAATPSISFSADADTGFYSSGANSIGISAGGAKVWDITSSGIVSPTAGGASIASAAGTAAAPTFSFAGDTDTGWYLAAPDTLAASTGGVERVRINSSGNVGIGTTNPTAKLDVGGRINLRSQATGSQLLTMISSADSQLLFKVIETSGGSGHLGIFDSDQNEQIIFRPDGTSFVNSTGNFGIGTTNPTSKLQVGIGDNTGVVFGLNDGTNSNFRFLNRYTDGYNYIQVGASTSDTSAKLKFSRMGTSGSLADVSFLSDQASFSGNVGVGTTAPFYKFQVLGPLNSAASPFNSTFTDSASYAADVGGGIGFGGYYNGTSTSNYGGIRAGKENATVNDTAGYLALYSHPNGGNPTERLRITSTGNIGIGTKVPGHILDVYGTNGASLYATGPTSSSTGGQSNWIRSPKNTVTAFIGDNDSVAAYTASDFSANLRFNGLTKNWGDFGFYPVGGGDGNYGNFRFSLAGTSVATTPNAKVGVGDLYVGGDVGIGTTNPVTSLDVASGALAVRSRLGTNVATTTLPVQGAYVGWNENGGYGRTHFMNHPGTGGGGWEFNSYDGTGNYLSTPVLITGSGNVGIGTTVPAEKLHVVGNALFRSGNVQTSISLESTTGTKAWFGPSSNGGLASGITNGDTVVRAQGQSLHLASDGVLMTLTAAGNVGIGTTSPLYKLNVIGDVAASGCLRSSAGVASGTCVSDERLKTDVHDFDLGLDALLGIQPHYFKYNGLGEHPKSSEPELGVIAQEVEKTAPQLVSTREVKLHPEDKQPTEIKQVNYTSFMYVLINAVKDLYHQWADDSQEIHRALASKDERIRALERENAAIKDYLCSKDPQAPLCH